MNEFKLVAIHSFNIDIVNKKIIKTMGLSSRESHFPSELSGSKLFC